MNPSRQIYFKLFFLFFLLQSCLMAQLSGNYTIGSGGNYTTFGAAVSALSSQGVNGAVTFNVKSGNYNEKFVIGKITGASSTNTITFQSQSGNASDVVIYFTATADSNNYVVNLNNAGYINFHKLTFTATGTDYGIVLNISNSSHDINISDNIIVGSTNNSTSDRLTTVYSYNTTFNNLKIMNNDFSQGSTGINLYGINDLHSTGVEITGNKFSSLTYMAVRLIYIDGLKLNSNESEKDNYYNFYIESCNGALQISKNKLSGMSYGLYVSNCAGGNPPVGKRGLIANNSVIVTSGGNFGLYIVNSSNQDIYYNSVHVTSTDVNSARAFYAVNGSSINVVNNIFANTGGGMAYYVNNTNIISSSDYNDLFTTGNYLAFWGSNSVDLTAFQTASGKDAHSISVFPHFASDTDLTPASAWVNGKAQVISAVTDDINGTARNASKPDLGAFEFTPDAAVATPLAGSYSIGSGGDYNTIKSALDDLSLKGFQRRLLST